eukprot:jgi/Tetstr1/431245/TSEL_020942.t1
MADLDDEGLEFNGVARIFLSIHVDGNAVGALPLACQQIRNAAAKQRTKAKKAAKAAKHQNDDSELEEDSYVDVNSRAAGPTASSLHPATKIQQPAAPAAHRYTRS